MIQVDWAQFASVHSLGGMSSPHRFSSSSEMQLFHLHLVERTSIFGQREEGKQSLNLPYFGWTTHLHLTSTGFWPNLGINKLWRRKVQVFPNFFAGCWVISRPFLSSTLGIMQRVTTMFIAHCPETWTRHKRSLKLLDGLLRGFWKIELLT